MCDPVEQSSVASLAWNTCTVVADESQLVVTPQQGWLFSYESPVVVSTVGLLSGTGGVLTVSGYNFGSSGADVVAWLEPRLPQVMRRIDLTVLTTNISTDASSGLQELLFGVGPGLGVNWTVVFTVKDQRVNQTTPSQQAALKVSFAAPRVDTMSISTGSTSGGYNVTLSGANFGTEEFFSVVGGCVRVLEGTGLLVALDSGVTGSLSQGSGHPKPC
jgi:hypothetical protein